MASLASRWGTLLHYDVRNSYQHDARMGMLRAHKQREGVHVEEACKMLRQVCHARHTRGNTTGIGQDHSAIKVGMHNGQFGSP